MEHQYLAKISVIIPIYNVEPYLRQCLDSVVNQTYRNLEIILVDDGSPDNCGVICDEYAESDDRIVVIHKQNGGVGAARNDGIERATGEWVAFVDPDDWCDVDYYERLLDAMQDQDVDIFCSGGHFREYGNKEIVCCSFTDSALFEGREQTDFLMAKTLATRCGIPIDNYHNLNALWNKLYKLSFLREYQLKFNLTFHPFEDVLFNFLAFDKASCVAVCSCIGYHYRKQVATASTVRFNSRMPDMCIAFSNSLNDYMRHREPNELIQDAISITTLIAFNTSAKCYYFHRDNPNPYRVIAAEIRELKREPAFQRAPRRLCKRE